MAVPAVVPAPPASAPAGRSGVCVLPVDADEILEGDLRLLPGKRARVARCIPGRDAPGARKLARRFEPHVALIDRGALDREPAACCRDLTPIRRPTNIRLLKDADAGPPNTVRASGAAAGFCSRGWAADDLLQTSRWASVGLATQPSCPPSQSSSSAREIVQLIADGVANREIAVGLYLARDIVTKHTSALSLELGAQNRSQAVQTVLRRGLLAV